MKVDSKDDTIGTNYTIMGKALGVLFGPLKPVGNITISDSVTVRVIFLPLAMTIRWTCDINDVRRTTKSGAEGLIL